MRLIATQEFVYGGKDLKIGDPFESASDEDARLLKGFGKAKDVPKRAAPLKTRAMKVIGDEVHEDKDGLLSEAGGPPRYHRTDMRAED